MYKLERNEKLRHIVAEHIGRMHSSNDSAEHMLKKKLQAAQRNVQGSEHEGPLVRMDGKANLDEVAW